MIIQRYSTYIPFPAMPIGHNIAPHSDDSKTCHHSAEKLSFSKFYLLRKGLLKKSTLQNYLAIDTVRALLTSFKPNFQTKTSLKSGIIFIRCSKNKTTRYIGPFTLAFLSRSTISRFMDASSLLGMLCSCVMMNSSQMCCSRDTWYISAQIRRHIAWKIPAGAKGK